MSSSTETQVDELRKIIHDEKVSIVERKAVAEHLVQLVVDAVPAPGDDHTEVVELRTPWDDSGSLGGIAPLAWKQRNLAYGWRESGPTQAQAIKRVHARHKLRVILGVVVDESAHRLTRLEACRRVLDELDPRNFHRANGYGPEQMLAKVLPASATKYGGWNKPPVPVKRPPQTLADVW